VRFVGSLKDAALSDAEFPSMGLKAFKELCSNDELKT